MSYRDSLLSLLAKVNPLSTVAEIGVNCGITSAMILDRFKDVTLYMIDPWLPYRDGEREVTQSSQDEARRKAQENTVKQSQRRVVIEATSSSALQDVPQCDAVFIDADHSYESVKQDMAWWGKVRPGGLFCGHDFAKPDIPGVTLAVEEFVAEYGLELKTAEGHLWWIIR